MHPHKKPYERYEFPVPSRNKILFSMKHTINSYSVLEHLQMERQDGQAFAAQKQLHS